MTKQIEALRQWVAESESIVFFGGAGVSTESGIPDFRSVDGLYHQKFQYPPETILSHSFYVRRKAEFYDFYRAKMLAPWAEPNAAHRKLAQWEQEGRLKAVITQNIDGLHQKAGSREVLAKAVHYIRQADLMIIGGTSLVVYPAAGLVQYFRGRHLVVVNKGQVGSNVGADLTIDGPIGQVFSQL